MMPSPTVADAPETSDVAFPESLCHRCQHLRVVRSGRGSMFLMCQEPTLPKYPRQPVAACGRFEHVTAPD